MLSVTKQGFHRIAYVEWGDPASSRVAICVHGLSRQSRDFDELAASLAGEGYRVVCPDLPGRGRSDWLGNSDDYNLPQYVLDMSVVIAALGAPEIDWIGTSLGGLTGILYAGMQRSPVRRLVINDVGPFLPWQALHRIGTALLSAPPAHPSFEAAVALYRRALAPFGTLTDEQWEHLTRHSIAEAPDGLWRSLADPGIAAAFRPGWYFNLSLWSYWDAITCPTLVLRGASSDLLLASTAAEMARRGPKAQVVEVAGCGHAPALLSDDQIEIVAGWLRL